MNDVESMRLALVLAERGRGWTAPNPMVGAVIVKDGAVIGQGWHERYGEPHAERNALAACTADPAGATMYVTLEPCCHHGKQPPCVDAILASGIRRVVIGSDPNPPVAGKGVAILRSRGVEVTENVLREECDALNRIFFHYITTGRPFVCMKYAMTMDGKIAAVLDGGACGVGVESTVITLALERPRLLRPGGITLEQLRSVLGEVDVDRALYEKIGDDVKVSAPGMKYRHYAPKAPVTVVRGNPQDTAKYIAAHIGDSTGVLCFDEYKNMFPNCIVECFGSRDDLGAQAREVFDRLRAFDDTSVTQIWAQCPSDEGLGLAVANRIKKAAGFSIIEV